MTNTILSIENAATCAETVTVDVTAVLYGSGLCRATLVLEDLDEWPDDEDEQIAFVSAYDPCWR
jgi:hypothetical protein